MKDSRGGAETRRELDKMIGGVAAEKLPAGLLSIFATPTLKDASQRIDNILTPSASPRLRANHSGGAA